MPVQDRKDPLTYAQAGVDIDAGNEAVRRIKNLVAGTRRPEQIGDIGGFAGLMGLPTGLVDPVLVACTDGVGTKLLVAIALDRHDTVGIDLVAMNVNDLLVAGAAPLFLLDYIACGKLKPDFVEAIVRGVVEGCRQAGCALIGGETAEMPGLYDNGHYDLAAFAVGVVERAKVLGPDRVRAGDVALGLRSSGLHSNGYSLARKALLGLAALVGVRPDELPYDFKLEQWGLRREPGESLDAYLSRVERSPIWRSRDISGWDLSPDGAKELNRRFPAQPEVYYFSWATSATVPLWPSRHQVPRPTMLPQLWFAALFIGAYIRDEPDHVRIDASWWENDGLVNTRSMAGPTLDSPDRIVAYGEPPQRGAWNYRGVLAGWDHMDIIGIGTTRDVGDWYLALARSLADLPP